MICSLDPQALFQIFMEIREKEKEGKNSTKNPTKPPPSSSSKNPKGEEVKIVGADPVTRIFDSSNYQHTVLNMSKTSGSPTNAIIFEPCLALAVTKILESTTDFFKDLFKKQDESGRKLEEEFKDFIAQCLLNNAQLNVCPSGGDEWKIREIGAAPPAEVNKLFYKLVHTVMDYEIYMTYYSI